jgi:hypothetical protein
MSLFETPKSYTEFPYTAWIKETEKAWHLVIEDIRRWVPKSVAKIDHNKHTILIENWFAEKMIQKGALFSDDLTRRYVLWRNWDDRLKTVLCIGLNPSTANDETDDQTITRLTGTLVERGYGALRMVNLFTIISSDPAILKQPEAMENESFDLGIIFGQAMLCQDIIFCWGQFKEANERAKKVIDFYADAKCFGKNVDGSPWHPLACMYAGFKPADSRLFNFSEHTFEKNVYNRKKRKKIDAAKSAGQTELEIPKPKNQLSLI